MLNREGGGLINFPPLKRGSLLEREGELNRGFTVSTWKSLMNRAQYNS